MARRLRAPRIPGQGPRPPRHNETNRQTKESRQRERLLDSSRANYFRYEMQDILKTSPTPPELHGALIQSLWAKGSRISVSEAKTFLVEKGKEGVVDRETQSRLATIIDRYATWR